MFNAISSYIRIGNVVTYDWDSPLIASMGPQNGGRKEMLFAQVFGLDVRRGNVRQGIIIRIRSGLLYR